jgi:hypothetical protein
MIRPIIILLLTFFVSCSNRKSSSEQEQEQAKTDTLENKIERIDSLQKQTSRVPTSFFIKDSTKYSKEFLKDFKEKHSLNKVETVALIDDTIIINNDRKGLIVIPTDLPLDKKIVYEGKRKDTTYRLIVKRINYSTIEYEYNEKQADKIIGHKEGLASLDPTFYYGAEGLIEIDDKAYGMNKYIDHLLECNTFILIGEGNISQSEFHHYCKNDKDNINSIGLHTK